jgi:hypothetical protein
VLCPPDNEEVNWKTNQLHANPEECRQHLGILLVRIFEALTACIFLRAEAFENLGALTS